MRTIDADALIETLRENPPVANIDRVIRDIEDAPTVAMGTEHVTINWTPDLDKLARDVAYRGLNEFKFLGKSIQEWVEIILEEPRWIPVKEKLPECKDIVLAYIEGTNFHDSFIAIAWLEENGSWGSDEACVDYVFTPSYWMPLPARPET